MILRGARSRRGISRRILPLFFHQPFEEFIHAGIVELGGNGSR